MLTLECKQAYLSLCPFGPISLPDLTILVGLNGSGKSHLLQGIEHQAVSFQVQPPVIVEPGTMAPVPGALTRIAPGVIRIENGGIAPQGLITPAEAAIAGFRDSAMPHSPEQSKRRSERQQREAAKQNFIAQRKALLEPVQLELLNEAQLQINDVTADEDLWRLGVEEVHSRIASAHGALDLDRVEKGFQQARETLTTIQLHTPSGPPLRPMQVSPNIRQAIEDVSEVVSIMRKDPLQVTEEDVAELYALGSFTIFDPQINMVFSAYRDRHASNVLARDAKSRCKRAAVLSDHEFVSRYGQPPWEQLSEILIGFELPYRVSPPDWRLNIDVVFSLEKISDGAVVPFQALSSGERVLVRFALSVFQFDPLRIRLSIPKLLLLDEMDASLHPEMVHRWLKAISKELVERRGIKVILTTHSPTTVALAPDGAFFEMVQGVGGPRKVSRQQALNRLTFGLPALSVDYDGRRQVFVESGTDAAAYEKLATILKADLDLPRTLTFIATGPRHGKKEENTGSSVVKHLVEELVENGNKSIFGIIDWDQINVSSERIKVLAEGTHYALDNVALNPLLIRALLLRNGVASPGTSVKVTDLSTLSPTRAQELADAVQEKLVYPEDAPAGRSTVRLIGGLSIEIRNAFSLTNGHKIEDALVKAFPALNRYHPSTRGALTTAVITFVLTDWRQLTPEPIATIFRDIASREFG